MGRPAKPHKTERIETRINAELKAKLDLLAVEKGTQVNALEHALGEYFRTEAPPQHLPLDEATRERLESYRKEVHGAPEENIAVDALRMLLRIKDDTQSEEFLVRLQNRSLIDRFTIYRESRESDRSRVAEKALDHYLLEQERRDSQYRAALNSRRRRIG